MVTVRSITVLRYLDHVETKLDRMCASVPVHGNEISVLGRSLEMTGPRAINVGWALTSDA